MMKLINYIEEDFDLIFINSQLWWILSTDTSSSESKDSVLSQL